MQRSHTSRSENDGGKQAATRGHSEAVGWPQALMRFKGVCKRTGVIEKMNVVYEALQ